MATIAVHSVWYPDSVLTGGEWDMFLLVPPLLDRPVERMLVIGNAGGTIARAYGRLYPEVAIDGVEIDPKVSEAGRRYLGLGDNAKLHVITDDGRPFLQGTSSRYDVIVVDAYRQPYIPFYLATEEFFRTSRPSVVILAAAKVGGILANDTYRADFIYQNLMIEANVIHAAFESGVENSFCSEAAASIHVLPSSR